MRNRFCLAVVGVVLFTSTGRTQTDGTWNVSNGSGSWSSASNWLGGIVPNGGGVATFGGVIRANQSVVLGNSDTFTVSGIVFSNVNSSGSYLVQGAGTVAFATGGTIVNDSSANNLLGSKLDFGTGITITGSGSGSLTLGSTQAEVGSTQPSGSGSVTINTTAANRELGIVYFGFTSASPPFGNDLYTGDIHLNSGTLGLIGKLGTGKLFINGANSFIAGSLTQNVEISNQVFLGTGANFIYTGVRNLTLTNVIDGAGSLVSEARGLPTGSATLTLTGANTYTGSTRAGYGLPLANTAGDITVGGAAGSILNSSALFATGGAALTLDNSGLAASISRIGGSVALTLTNGTFRVLGGADAGAFAQTSSGTATGLGYSSVVAQVNSPTAESVTIAFTGGLVRPNRGTFLFSAPNSAALGGAAGTGVARFDFGTTAPAGMVGGSNPGVSDYKVIPYALGDMTGSGGNLFVTYDANGVRPLTALEQATTLNPGSNLFQNVRLTEGATSPIPAAYNAIGMTGAGFDIGGSGSITLVSGLLFANATASNAAFSVAPDIVLGPTEGNVFVTGGSAVTGHSLTLNGSISGSNGLTKSGTGTLVLNGANTYTGTTTINDGAIRFNSMASFGNSTSAIIGYSRNSNASAGIEFGPSAAAAVEFTRTIETRSGLFGVNAGKDASVLIMKNPAPISGSGGLVINNVGRLGSSFGSTTYLTGTNTYLGGTRLNGGTLAIASDAALGASSGILTATANGSRLELHDNITTQRTVYLTANTILDTNGYTMMIQGAGMLTGYQTATAGIDGTNTQLLKIGDGTLVLSSKNPFLGQIFVNQGRVLVTGGGTLSQMDGQLQLTGGILELDYTDPVAPSRQNANSYLTVNGGTYQINVGSNNVTQSLSWTNGTQTRGILGVGGRSTYLRLSADSGGLATLTVQNLVAGNSLTVSTGTIIFAGDGLGGDGTSGSNVQVNDTSNMLVIGGILKGVFGDTVSTGFGSGYVLYDTAARAANGGVVGVRLLDVSEYATSVSAGVNLRVAGPVSSAANATINSLFLTAGGTLTINSGTSLTNTSGMILSTQGANIISSNLGNGGGATLLTTASSNFHIVSDLTINARIATPSGTTTLTKTGPGTLTLNPIDAAGAVVSNALGGNINIGGGTIAIGTVNPNTTIAAALGTPTNFTFNSGTLKYAGSNLAVITNSGFSFSGAGGTLDFTGAVVQFARTSSAFTNANDAPMTFVGGTLVLGNGTNAVPNPIQPNGFQGKVNLNGGIIVLNAQDSQLLGTGVLNLNGGSLAARFNTRTVFVPVNFNADTTLLNNLTITGLGSDTSNSGFVFAAPVNLGISGTRTLNNHVVGGSVTFASTIYDNPFDTGVGIVFTGPSTALTVLNGANLYRGGTTIAGGTLSISSDANLGAAAGGLTIDGGTLQVTGTAMTSTARVLTLGTNGAGFDIANAANTFTISQGLTGSTSVTKRGAGTLRLTGVQSFDGGLVVDAGTLVLTAANSYSGGTTLNGGTVSVSNDNQLGDSGSPLNFNGGVLQVTGTAMPNTARTIAWGANGGGFDIAASGFTFTVSQQLSGTGSLSKSGAGTLVLNNTSNSYSGGTLVNAGLLTASGANTLGAGGLTIASGATVGLGTTAQSIAFLSGAGNITRTTAALTINQSVNTTYSGVLAGTTGTLTKAGVGTLTLAGANTFAGAVTVTGGALSVALDANLGAAGATLALNGGALQVAGTAFNSTSRTITLGGSGGTFDIADPANTFTLSQVFTGSGSLRKAGDGTLVLTATTGSYSGGTVIDDGALSVGANANLGGAAGGITLNGGTLQITGTTFTSTARSVTLGSNGGGFDVANAANTFTLSQLLSGTGGLTKGGAGTLVLSAANTYSGGTTVAAGTLSAGVANALGTGTLTIIAPGSLNLNNFNQAVGSLGGSGVITLGSATLTVNQTGPTTYSGVIQGSGAVVVTGTGMLTLTGANSYTGGTSVSGGTLRAGVANALAATGALALGASGTFDLNGFDQRVASLSGAGAVTLGAATLTVNQAATTTLSGSISGTGSLVKNGFGTLNLTGTNGFSGGLTVAAGTVGAASDAALGAVSNNVVVNPLGTLAFTSSTSTSRTLNLTTGTLSVAAGQTLTLSNAAVNGGFLAGPGTFATQAAATTYVAGATTAVSANLTLNGSDVLANVINGGNLTAASGSTAMFVRVTNQASGRISVGIGATVNAQDFQSIGQLNVTGTGVVSNTGGSQMVLGGGSVTNVGVYNPSTGQVTAGGTLNIGSQDLYVSGGFLRNNGTITGAGTLVIDAGATVKGAGDFDTGNIVVRNGGVFAAGNSPGLTRTSNLTVGSAGVQADFSNATGVAGPPLGSTGTQLSGWGVFEYGSSSNGGGLRIEGTTTNKATFRFRTVLDGGDYNTAGVPIFDPTQSYTWVVFRPRSAADSTNPLNNTPTNTAAQITLTDSQTGLTYTIAEGTLNDTTLNQYIQFDQSQWAWNVPVAERGTFRFTLLDGRTIAVVYTPTPEPAHALLLSALAIGATLAVRRRMRREAL